VGCNTQHSKKLGVSAKGVAIKNLRNRWGSLTKNSTISLNLNLVKAPEDIIDYIVLHELCHLRIKEHSKRKSLRSTIPMSVVKNMGLKVGDNISWTYEIRNGEIVTTVRKVKRSLKR
jgi:hypothetical protein